jgi:hypothetical protein
VSSWTATVAGVTLVTMIVYNIQVRTTCETAWAGSNQMVSRLCASGAAHMTPIHFAQTLLPVGAASCMM